MRKLLILSGKGGTGKTTVAAAFICFSESRLYADCDVDAPNLHILMKESGKPDKRNFYGQDKARISAEKCFGCGKCMESCRFGAIKSEDGKMWVDELLCEGCGVCQLVCKNSAVQMEKDQAGTLEKYQSDHLFSTATLKMGRGNSGKLVSEVKNEIFRSKIDTKIMVVDGSPGIGCPVIASASGMDMVLAVIEPSISGMSDLERLYSTVKTFGCEFAVCVNKYDISPEKTEQIKSFCNENSIMFAGVIPFDKNVVKAVNEGINIALVECPAKRALEKIYKNVINGGNKNEDSNTL